MLCLYLYGLIIRPARMVRPVLTMLQGENVNLMGLLLGIILLFTTVVVANVIHLIYPKLPLSIYQIIAGSCWHHCQLLPLTTMHPELFMMVVIAP